ncbi:MAG: gliding motility-associated C-terminal domain-containing protein [Gemmatimonadaceae bacterium]|nr:gliding motility-associated C-terminal domain-containing protein [Gemmatimonadaceae bacterium]
MTPRRAWLPAVTCLLVASAPAVSLDTLRVGISGNVSWSGQSFLGGVTTIPPEYQVARQLTEIGSTPGNLIDLERLGETAPRLLVKTVLDAVALDVAELTDQLSASLPSALERIPEVEETEIVAGGNLFSVILRLAPGTDLPSAVEVVDEALEEVRQPGINPVVLPIALMPDHLARGRNVAHLALGLGGRIEAPAIKDVPKAELEEVLLELITPEGSEDAFQRKGARGALGTFVVLDLGAPIGVNRVRFYPRNTVQQAPAYPFQNDFLRQFELMLHDGQNLVLDGTGRLVPQLQDYDVLRRTVDNQDAVVDVPVSPARLVRFVRLKSISSFPYEIDELEVFGQGFISEARYLSPIYDLGSVATWGNISWVERFIDRRQETGARDETSDNCQLFEKEFATAEEVPETWGDCETAGENRPGTGYITVWNCVQSICRDEFGGQTVIPGRAKRVAAPAARPAQLDRGEDVSQILVRTRTGSDPTPLIYWRRNVERTGDPERSESLADPSQPLDREEYLELSPNFEASPPVVWDKGEITDDLGQWSPWSAPYRSGHLPAGEPILSPGPRRYIQFSVEFRNQAIDATKVIEQLSIEYLSPPIADDLIAEIYPREVEAFEAVPFTYAVRALMDIPGVKGFDRFEISTPTRVLGIDRIQILDGTPEEGVLFEAELNADITPGGDPQVVLADGSRHPVPYMAVSAAGDSFGVESVTDQGFAVRFPAVERPATGGQRLVMIDFRSRVLLYSTVFRGAAGFAAEAGTVQRITPGNASFLGEGDLPTASGITVLSPSITRGSLVGAISLEPNPFTPNGDGVNDRLEVAYDITAITRPAQVSIVLFDLSGRRVRELYQSSDLSGHYDPGSQPQLGWDGRDDGGNPVPPGIYILRVSVQGDARTSEQVRTVAVAY